MPTPQEIIQDAVRLWNSSHWSQIKDPQLYFRQVVAGYGIKLPLKLNASDTANKAAICVFLRDWANKLEGKSG